MTSEPDHIHPEFHRMLGRVEKEKLLGQRGCVLWLYGLSGSGKSTLANALERRLHAEGIHTKLLDGDNVRTGLNRGLGFSDEDRLENIRRIAEVAKLFLNAGVVTIASFITPKRALREMAREIVGEADFQEVFVKCSFENCAARDVKGLYAKADSGQVNQFTGVDSEFEEPENADLVIDSETESIDESCDKLYEFVSPLIRPSRLPDKTTMHSYKVNHVKQLEAEAIFVLRETAAQFEKPALLFSGGKDSIVMAHLARKAFHPAKLPFPLLHVDTGHNFSETIEFRDRYVAELGARLIVGLVQDSIDKGRVVEEKGPTASRNALQTVTLLDALEEHGFDTALGGGRRDEEKARAKERFFSHRNDFGEWDPKGQRPELWNIFNGRKHHGEHFRVFPLSNWTEMDVWQYIKHEEIELPNLYFSHSREVVERGGALLATSEFVKPQQGEKAETRIVRFRTIGDMTCTGAVESKAATLDDIIAEVAAARQTERGTRADDKRSETAMEDRKKQGYC